MENKISGFSEAETKISAETIIIRPEIAFPKLSTDEERLTHINEFSTYYSKFNVEKISNYVLGSKFNEKSDLARPYVSSLDQTIGEDDFKIESLYAEKISSKTFNVTQKRKIDNNDPNLAEINVAIETIKTLKDKSSGKEKYILQKTLIELYKDRQIVYDSNHLQHKPALTTINPFDRQKSTDQIGLIDFTNDQHIKEAIKIFPELIGEKEDFTNANSSIKALMDELLELLEAAQNIRPGDRELILLRMKGYTNVQIKPILAANFKMDYTTDYYSTLFNKICKKLADWKRMQQEQKGKETNKYAFAVCTRCGEKKLLDPTNWVRKHTSPTGFAARCKLCDKEVRAERKENKQSTLE